MKGDIRFETQTVYDQAALAVGQKVLEFRDPALKSSIRSARLMLGGFGGVIFGLGGMSLSWQRPIAVTVILMVLGALIASVGLFYRQVLQFGSRKAVTGETETARFYDDGFSIQSPKREAEHPYSHLLALYRKGGYLFLFFDRQHAYIVNLKPLSPADREALPAFLEQKTGKTVMV